jgi:hypothetical protein
MSGETKKQARQEQRRQDYKAVVLCSNSERRFLATLQSKRDAVLGT